MSELSFHQQSVLWGQTYEVLVKRGSLAYLLEQRLIEAERLSLKRWRETKLLAVSSHLTSGLELLDENARDVIKAAVRHLALTAYGVGYTAMRAYVDSVRAHFRNPDLLKVQALWCPLQLPGESTAEESTRALAREAFHSELGLTCVVDPDWSRKGQPANADFLLWLGDGARRDFLLVQEYSFDMQPAVGDYRQQDAHLDEILRHRRIVDSRSVFARVAAEVDGEAFELSDDIKNYLTALTSDNKPLYKLCQACSYVESTVSLLKREGRVGPSLTARALAVTPNGLESVAAAFNGDYRSDPRCDLMGKMGAAYRGATKIRDGDDDGLDTEIARVFAGVVNKLPAALRKGMRDLSAMPKPGQDYVFEFTEAVPEFANPAQEFTLSSALDQVDSSAELDAYFGGHTKEVVGTVMRETAGSSTTISLRDMHASAIVAGLQSAKRDALNVLALEGNPGIGKTTAIRTHLSRKSDGYLFLYVSPRVVINRDVTESLARKSDKSASGILTLTTNAQLIASAERWHKKQVELGKDTKRNIDGALVADGVPDLCRPNGSVLVLTPEQEQEIDNEHAGTKLGKHTLSEHEDLVKDRPLRGVLATMASTAKELLTLNPAVKRLVLTAALQGFRERSNKKTTIEALSGLFANKASTAAGREERRQFARKMPNIVVMVDELAGDGAGAPFVHAVATWLTEEFLDCFEDDGSPFTVTLVVSDASLGNEVVLDRYLSAGDRTPDKVLVSKSDGKRPYRLAATKVKVGTRKRDTLHVMTNSFPAGKLDIRYRVKLSSVTIQDTPTGETETPRQAIRRVAEGAVLAGARAEVLGALRNGARQVIYFAQDKMFLRDLRSELLGDEEFGLKEEDVQVLDSSVPGWKRKQLVEPATRDKVRVFLMTSSGARGVSFPMTDWIIATVPRFNIEAALMEIAQLIYRGRGKYEVEPGVDASGDHADRHLVMLVDDYVVFEDGLDRRQWLRQSLDLMTLLVMLRSTIFTRITGDAGLKQPLALVPVGAVGVDELISLMSQYVSQFVKEAELYRKTGKSKELQGLAARALTNVVDIFSRTKLSGVARKGEDGRTFVKADCVREFLDVAVSPINSLLPPVAAGVDSLPAHVHFSGPVVVETWQGFEKQEVFAFEGHESHLRDAMRQLKGQLHAIDQERQFPGSLRVPAASLLKLLQRDEHDAANEFKTLKQLKSPNTWIAVPAGYYEFMHSEQRDESRPFTLGDQALWQEALGRSLNAGAAVMPPLPSYESFPWAAAVGEVSPLKLDLVFDDRYFMASNELNLLNTLLLAVQNPSSGTPTD